MLETPIELLSALGWWRSGTPYDTGASASVIDMGHVSHAAELQLSQHLFLWTLHYENHESFSRKVSKHTVFDTDYVTS